MRQILYRTEYEKKESETIKLEYFLLENEQKTSYGVKISMEEPSHPHFAETSDCDDVTTDRSEIINILDWMADNHAQPVHLLDLIEDYFGGAMELCAKTA